MPQPRTAPVPLDNHLLARLPAGEYQRLLPNLEFVTLSLGELIRESRGEQEYAYFPAAGVVSFLCSTEEGATVEVGLTGNDGVVGVALFLGGTSSPYRAVVQIAGAAFRMRSKVFQREFAGGSALQSLLLRYTQALLTQVCQTAACNRLHPLEKRLCRWLLLCHDRVPTNEIPMTQEFIANMLGGRRESVTVAAGHLQDAKLIEYSRGHIRVLDRKGIEAFACECYRVVKTEADRLMGSRARAQALAARQGGAPESA